VTKVLTRYLEAWLKSPYVGRRRKALRILGKYAVQGKYDRKAIFETAKRALNDKDWKVRAVAASVIADIANADKNFASEAFTILYNHLEKEKHPNVRGNILRGLSKLVDIKEPFNAKNLFEIGLDLLKSPNGDVRHGSIQLLSQLVINFGERINEVLSSFDAILPESPPLLKKEILRLMREIYTKYPNDSLELFTKITMESLKENSYLILEEALANLSILIRDRKLALDNDIIMLVRRKLRSEKIAVKIAALGVVDAILSIEPKYADAYLDIIGREILLKEKNRRIKIRALELLVRHIDRIPRDIIYQYRIPRVLDILDLNTVPKNDELRTIKELARILLERKLGYDYAARIRLRVG